ncbi:MAG TPA: tetratricopeptide repeat protein [Pyrinomonadaceae bacterium]|nr:tetratricopeptide repeat protein [Pyrinomonadaceae bacterium]
MSTRKIQIDSPLKKAALLVAAVACIGGAYFFAKWGLVNSAVLRVDNGDLALYLTTLAPDDPLPHYASAVFLEQSFEPADVEHSLKELETATGLAPGNYLYWLDLGRARERSGDAEGAERALRQSLALAPNYSRVQWALGNALLRQGRREEAFAEIQKAVSGDPAFAMPAAVMASQFFDGNIDEIRRNVGASARLDAALAALLIGQKKYDEAIAIWETIPAADKSTTVKDIGATLFTKLMEARRLRQALNISYEIDSQATRVEPGNIVNGGFESAVKLEGAGPYEWQVAGGLQPQIVLTNGKKHGGNNSLLLVFNTNTATDFRNVTLMVPVEPNTEYDFQAFYSSDLKTNATFKWEVADAFDGRTIASTNPVGPSADWTPLTTRFKSSNTSDGIIIRLVRGECGAVCPVAGNLWFDDISLRRANQ